MNQRPSLFVRLADAVSFGMGTPANIAAWILAVMVWIALFATGALTERTNLLPAWFTSNAFNFPLNTVTTLAELYIGFLVAAAANRNERANREMIAGIRALLTELTGEERDVLALEQQTTATEADVKTLLLQNTALTQAVHDLTAQIHQAVSQR